MPKTQLRLRQFKTLDEFKDWWQSPEVTGFCDRHPSKMSRLGNHRWVKPWLEKIQNETTKPPAVTAKKFGKYEVIRKLGQGGMGVVYLANDPTLKRQVALKVMSLKGDEAIERFMREARATAKLKHPNIIQVYEINKLGEYYYFSMEYVEGSSLSDLIRNEDISPKRVAKIMHDIANALDYAHKQGIIHRDLKPANILIDKNNKPYLTDFGLAKELKGIDKSLTLSGVVIGTPDYMSPEQALGEKNIGIKSDIFSLGSTFYHALTGKAPFREDELYRVMDRVVNKDPARPRSFNNTIHQDLEAIIMQCMEKNPNSRYKSAEFLTKDIINYLEGRGVSAQSYNLLHRAKKSVRRHKLIYSIATSAIILVGIFGYFAWMKSEESAIVQKDKIEAESKTQDILEALLSDMSKTHEEALSRRRAGEPRKNLMQIPERVINSALYKQFKDEALDNFEVHYSLGRLYRIIGEDEKALEEQEIATSLEPSFAAAQYEKGILQFRLYNKHMEKIQDQWRKDETERRLSMRVATSTPLKIPSYKDLEDNYGSALKQDSLKALKISSKSDDKNIRLMSLGMLDFINQDIKSAEKKFKQIIKDDPTFTDAVELQVLIYESSKRYKTAIILLSDTLRHDKGNIGFYATRARLRYMVSIIESPYNFPFPEKSLADWNKVIELDPFHYGALLTRGKLYMNKASELSRTGKDPEDYFSLARTDLKKAVKANPTDPMAFIDLAVLNGRYGDYCWGVWYNPNMDIDPTKHYEAGIESAEKAWQIDNTDVRALYALSNIAMNYGHYTKTKQRNPIRIYKNGIDAANRAIKIDKNDARAWHHRASLYSVIGLYKFETGKDPSVDYIQSLSDYKKAYNLDPDNISIYLSLGSLYNTWGNWRIQNKLDAEKELNLSEQCFDRVIDLRSNDSSVYQKRAMTKSSYMKYLIIKGRFDEAFKKGNQAIADWELAAKYNKSMKKSALAQANALTVIMAKLRNDIEKNRRKKK